MVHIHNDGSLWLNMEYFKFATGLEMTRNKRWQRLLGIPKRHPESAITQEYIDLAMAIQQITEKIVVRLATTARQVSGSGNLVMAGGVALNCVANAKIKASGLFDHIWIQPAAGDAGGAVGAALASWHIYHQKERKLNVRSEPIVCSPDDAYRCFLNTGMDCLVMENYLFFKFYTS